MPRDFGVRLKVDHERHQIVTHCNVTNDAQNKIGKGPGTCIRVIYFF